MRLHRMQQKFRQSDAIYRGFVGGRGAGKTYIGAYDMIRRARNGRTYLVASPTSVLMQDTTFPTFKQIAKEMGRLGAVKLTPYPNVELTTGATVRFRTAEDPEKMRGPNLSGVWLDEASLMPMDAFLIPIAALREGGEQGWLTATFTPKGVAHWTYQRFGTAQPNTALFKSTTAENPFNPATFAAMLEQAYGPGSAFARQELSGEFVDDDDAWQVIPSAWVRAAQARWTPTPPEGQALSAIGVDVAHGGADCTAVSPRYGTWFAPIKKYQGTATDTGEKAAYLVMKEYPDGADAPVNVDAIGYGSECHAELRKLIGKNAIAVNVAAAPDPEMFDRTKKYKLPNFRSAMHWRLREALDPLNGDNLSLPPGLELLADLTAARFEVRSNGIHIEKKNPDIKERLGRSPDVGESLMLAYFEQKLWKLKAENFFL